MRVVILGCGYVGIELGRQLQEGGHEVIGVRRSATGVAAVEAAGIEPIEGDVTDPDALASIPDADALVYLTSPGRGGVDAARSAYVEGLRATLDEFERRSSPPDRLCYASSTGVYGDHRGGWVDERTTIDPTTDREAVLAEAESIARDGAIDGTVVRFAGLYGPERYRLERYLDGPITEGWVNLLHRDDAAGTIRFLLERDLGRGEVLLAVDNEPIERPALARWLAEQCGVEPPETVTVEERIARDDPPPSARRRIRADKRCCNERLRELGYEFSYPTYRHGYQSVIENCHNDG